MDAPGFFHAPEDTAKTKDNFAQALEEVLAGVSGPPITFLPLSDTCEQLLTKIQGAAVQHKYLQLPVDHQSCTQCGIKIGVVQGQHVMCYMYVDGSTIPYEE